ncbi:MAG TPA: hypothetical protein VMD55_09775 [Terracidiphilus sp.]|nr:hypothetical protein [Terracidiphilus sp.]
MNELNFPWLFQRINQFRIFPLAAAGFFAATLFSTPVRAQNAAPPGPLAAVQPAPANPAASNSVPSSDDAWLQKAGSLYYSTAKSGLGGFDCAVHPDWRTLFSSANAGSPIDANDARILLLESVKINLHAHLEGGSTLEWTPQTSNGEPLDQDASTLLTKMHEVTEQTLEGFLQFWTPFIDGSVVPASADGLTITHSGSVNTIHAQDSDLSLTETFSNDMLLEHFDVDQNGISIKFQPAYKPTGQGLLVKSFQAHVQPAGVPPEQAEEMHAEIEYQTLEGFPIPSRLNMATSTGQFNFTLDGCTVSRLQRPEPANVVKPALQ